MQAGKKAKGPTAEEFATDVLAPTVKEAERLVKPKLGKVKGKKVKVQHSFDSARIHESAMTKQEFRGILQGVGWRAVTKRFPLPKYSPDMHKVIEHTHARAVVQWEKWLYKHPGSRSPQQYMQEFERMYRNCSCAEVIKADVAKLPALYKWVKENHGAWAPRTMR